jgi:single-stranded-DNA-specific exonuclease
MAAGLTIAAERLTDFQTAFAVEVGKWMTLDDARGVIHSDGEIDACDFTLDAARALRNAGPWGQAFPEPLFDGCFDVVERRVLGERHLKLKVRCAPGAPPVEAIAFRHFDHDDAPEAAVGSRIEMAYRLDVNEYQNTERLQLVVELIRQK